MTFGQGPLLDCVQAYEPWVGVTQQRVLYLLLLETSYFCHHHVLRVFCWEKGEQRHALDRRALLGISRHEHHVHLGHR